MKRSTASVAILGGILVALSQAAPANAQATRTWVSGVGDDANPCSRTAPCKTFAGAISKTAGGGEINVLDPGGFGGVTIGKSITISSSGFEAGVLVSGTPGITVAAGATDSVVLEGLDIEGLGTGTNGVNFVSGALLVINKSKIHHFATNGVFAQSSTAGARTVINQSLILSNGTSGNANTGGVDVAAGGGNTVNFIDTLVQNNLNYGVRVTGGTAAAAFQRSTVNPVGITSVSGGLLFSFGPSNVFGSGAPNQPVINFQ
jgi:hypothetical protein